MEHGSRKGLTPPRSRFHGGIKLCCLRYLVLNKSFHCSVWHLSAHPVVWTAEQLLIAQYLCSGPCVLPYTLDISPPWQVFDLPNLPCPFLSPDILLLSGVFKTSFLGLSSSPDVSWTHRSRNSLSPPWALKARGGILLFALSKVKHGGVPGAQSGSGWRRWPQSDQHSRERKYRNPEILEGERAHSPTFWLLDHRDGGWQRCHGTVASDTCSLCRLRCSRGTCASSMTRRTCPDWRWSRDWPRMAADSCRTTKAQRGHQRWAHNSINVSIILSSKAAFTMRQDW